MNTSIMDGDVPLFERVDGRPGLLRLRNYFYADARQRQLPGPAFYAQIKHWAEHIETIAAFGTQIPGGPPEYAGQMAARHMPLCHAAS